MTAQTTTTEDLDGQPPHPGHGTTNPLGGLGGLPHWKIRHTGHSTWISSQMCANDENGDSWRRCRCEANGTPGKRCCEHRDGDDGMCTPCRRWCQVTECLFTFGYDHTHPRTGKPLAKCWVRVPGNLDASRDAMLALFGRDWAMQYPATSERIAKFEALGMREVPFG